MAQRYNARFAGVVLRIATSTPAWIFSQMRGTPRKTVGETSTRSWRTVSSDSPKCTVAPEVNGVNWLKIFSATWHSGR